MKYLTQFLSIGASLWVIATAPPPSVAQTTPTSSTPVTNISNEYSRFLAKVNSQQVVNDLRNGQWTTTATDPNTKVTTTTTEALPTGKMGYGNVKISLALAQESLRQQGITQPTSEQLHTTLAGDSTTNGILQMRADGMGWGQIAQKYDVKLGQLMSGRQSASTTVTSKGFDKSFAVSDSQGSGIVTASGRASGAAAGHASQSSRGIVSGSGRSMGQSSGIVTGSGRGQQYGASSGGNSNGEGHGRGPR